jgi:hypothetical protein
MAFSQGCSVEWIDAAMIFYHLKMTVDDHVAMEKW